MEPLRDLTIKKFHAGLLEKKFSALEITQASFEHIKRQNPEINAFLSTAEASAVAQAEKVDIAVAKDETLGPLAGVPLAIKDCILIKDLPATAASKILEYYVASYDAGVIGKLKAENAVFLGKTNLDEFAMGSSTEISAFGVVKNPHDTTRVAGGSSGGSVAAVAAHMALGALGTDTGGSIRLPSSFCGTVGMSPTYGAVSRSGVIAMASSLDQVGPIAKTCEDAAIIFNAIRGRDPLDATSAPIDYNEKELLEPELAKIKDLAVGLPEEYFIEGLEPEVRHEIDAAIEKIKGLGLKFKKISLPHTKYALSVYYIIVPAEVSSNLARFDGIRYARNASRAAKAEGLTELYFKNRGAGFGAESKRRIILGTFVLSSGYYDAYYLKAQQVRRILAEEFLRAFAEVDAIVTPTSPTPAFKLGEKCDDPVAMYLADIYTVTASLAGICGVNVPCGTTKAGLPVGMQVLAAHFNESAAFRVARAVESAQG